MRASWYVHLCVGLSLFVCLQITSLPALAVEKGDIAPDFTFPSLLESNFVTLSDYKGKVVFLDFWSAWCSPCRDSLPRLVKMRNSFSSEQFELVSIDVDVEPKDAVKFLQDVTSGAPVNYPLAMDPGAVSARLYSYTTIPASYLINQNGVIEQVHANFQAKDIDGLKQEILKLINGRYKG